MITRPFDFAAHLRRPSAHLEAVPFIDACLLLLFFAVLGSRFVLAPGVAIDLPATRGAPPDAVVTTRMLTVAENDGQEMLIYDGRIHRFDSFAAALEAQRSELAGEVLLVRMDRDVSMRVWVKVCELAEQAGFVRVLMAAEPERALDAGPR
jgi:biopolymer transport protein ExbD